jgi:hypothetical protein
MFDWDEIRRELQRLRELDFNCQAFGAQKHHYQSTPVPEVQLQAVEKELGYALPPDYREFLKQIGYGAGPEYGLYSPEQALAETVCLNRINGNPKEGEFCHWMPDDRGYGQLFHFRDLKAEHVEIFIQKHKQGGFECAGEIGPCILCLNEGGLVIQTRGCIFYHVLICEGELAGTMWEVALGEAGAVPRGVFYYGENREWVYRARPYTFEEWYKNWLDYCSREIGRIRAAEAEVRSRNHNNEEVKEA